MLFVAFFTFLKFIYKI